MVNIIEIATKAMQDLIKGVVDAILTRTDVTTSSRQAAWGAVAGTKTNIDNTAINVGSNADVASETGSVHAKLKDLKANSGAVKSVQRGRTLVQGSAAVNVTISAVNLNKAIVIVQPGMDNIDTSTAPNTVGAGRLTSTTTLRLLGMNTGYHVLWEVIEFY